MTDLPDFDANHSPKPGDELLWAIRTWVIGTVRQVPVEDRIRDELADAGFADAAGFLFGFMWVMGLGTTRKLTIACACHPCTTPGEQLLLDVVALYQDNRPLEAMLLLRSVLPPRAALAARDSAEALAAVLTTSEYWLTPPWGAAVQQAALVGVTMH